MKEGKRIKEKTKGIIHKFYTGTQFRTSFLTNSQRFRSKNNKIEAYIPMFFYVCGRHLESILRFRLSWSLLNHIFQVGQS